MVFVPYEKLSKKKQKEIDAQKRGEEHGAKFARLRGKPKTSQYIIAKMKRKSRGGI